MGAQSSPQDKRQTREWSMGRVCRASESGWGLSWSVAAAVFSAFLKTHSASSGGGTL